MVKKKVVQDEMKVYCRDCKNFLRDHEGISRNIDSKEYFMGICLVGQKLDSEVKQFADNSKICKRFKLNKQY